MKSVKALIVFTAFALVTSAAFAAQAAQMNFKPANSSSAAVAENKSRMPVSAPQAPSGEGFWEKEGKRSGLAETANGMGASLRDFFGFGWVKQKEDEYRTRNPKSK